MFSQSVLGTSVLLLFNLLVLFGSSACRLIVLCARYSRFCMFHDSFHHVVSAVSIFLVHNHLYMFPIPFPEQRLNSFSSIFLEYSPCQPSLIDSVEFQSSTFILPHPCSYRFQISASPTMDGIYQLLYPGLTFTHMQQASFHQLSISFMFPPHQKSFGLQNSISIPIALSAWLIRYLIMISASVEMSAPIAFI